MTEWRKSSFSDENTNCVEIAWRKSSFSGESTNCVEIAWQKSTFSGTNTNCVEVGWRKSTFSDSNTNCVEVAMAPDLVGVRDSKNIAAPALMFPAPHWHQGLSVFKTHKPRP